MGLLYVARALEDAGHQVEVIDLFCEQHLEDAILRSLPSVDTVGISVYTKNYTVATDITKLIKQHDPNLPIILGGPHCTFNPKKALVDIPSADISVEGEGEPVINNIAQALQGKSALADIPGLSYREQGTIRFSKPPVVVEDLDSLGFPSRHLVEKYEYGKMMNMFFYKPRFTALVSSRGCPFRCRFCTRHVTTMKRFRMRSAENVVREFQELQEKYRSVLIVDDNFLADRKRANQILDGLIENKSDLELFIEGARVDTADRELYKKMKKAGVKQIAYGIESGNQDVLDYYHKNVTLDQIRHALNLAREMHFVTLGTFIVGAPIETREHIENTIKFACSLPLDIALFGQLAYQHGSDLWNEAVSCGKIKEDEGYAFTADKRRGLGNFTEEELEKFCNQAFRRFFFRPRYLAEETVLAFLRRDFRLLKVGWSFLVQR